MMPSADALLQNMVTSGIAPDLMVYNSLLGGFARQGLFVDAMHLVKRLKAEGFQPDAATYKVRLRVRCSMLPRSSGMEKAEASGSEHCRGSGKMKFSEIFTSPL